MEAQSRALQTEMQRAKTHIREGKWTRQQEERSSLQEQEECWHGGRGGMNKHQRGSCELYRRGQGSPQSS